MKNTCSTCAAWNRLDRQWTWAQCRRRPPPAAGQQWPITFDYDWCLDWIEQPETREVRAGDENAG